MYALFINVLEVTGFVGGSFGGSFYKLKKLNRTSLIAQARIIRDEMSIPNGHGA